MVGAVGRLVREKGYLELFEAWDGVRAAHPTAELVVVGPYQPDKADGIDEAVVARATDAGIRFLGMRDDVERIYRALDLYVLLSYREGFPRSAMEAAASGLPIVATDIRGCRQVVDDGVTGVLVPQGRRRAAAPTRSARWCATTASASAMAAAAVELAPGTSSTRNVCIEITLQAYRDLLGGRARPTRTGTTEVTDRTDPDLPVAARRRRARARLPARRVRLELDRAARPLRRRVRAGLRRPHRRAARRRPVERHRRPAPRARAPRRRPRRRGARAVAHVRGHGDRRHLRRGPPGVRRLRAARPGTSTPTSSTTLLARAGRAGRPARPR